MANEIVRHDVQSLVDGWLEAERSGNQFPVPFDTAWPMAGYSRKDSAKRGLKGLREGKHLSTQMWKTPAGGRSKEVIHLSCDAFKHLCLMADTPEGEAIRDYFIECEKKWKLVQQHAPQFAQEIEILHLKAEIAKQEAIKAAAEQKTIELRHYVVTALPESVQQKVLGYEVVKEIEYRDRIIFEEDLVKDGSTMQKWELCERYGIKTKNGKPDFKKLNNHLSDLPPEAFSPTMELRQNVEFRREWLPMLDRLIINGNRNLHLGE